MKTALRQQVFQAAVLCVMLSGVARAWGPHPEITQAALDALGPETALVQRLGDDTRSLCTYCWMPDWRRSLHREKDVWFYTDDYLLMPALPEHVDHLCPAVKRTYAPCFRRALQALRTENAQNASRWVGTLVHFTEDSGAPPHAGEIKGDLHGKLENWVDAKAIHIPGYKPRVLGATDDEALAGYLQRMEGLIAFSRQRCERAKPFAVSGERAAAEPIILESALESSRVVADLLLTLGELAKTNPAENNTALRGTLTATPGGGVELVPAKVMLMGTAFSTLADAAGRYVFQHLPPGPYTLAVLRPGSAVTQAALTLAAGRETVKDLTLPQDTPPGNMLRNSALSLHWLTPDRPDAWYPTKKAKTGETAWEGEMLPLQADAIYRLQSIGQDQAAGRVVLRIFGPPPATKPMAEMAVADPTGTLDLATTQEMRLAQVVIYSKAAPDKVCQHVAFWRVPGAAGR
jgi:hypothetical protein